MGRTFRVTSFSTMTYEYISMPLGAPFRAILATRAVVSAYLLAHDCEQLLAWFVTRFSVTASGRGPECTFLRVPGRRWIELPGR